MLSALIILAAEAETGEPAIHPYAVGAIALALLLALVLAVVSIGGGREHS